MHRGSVPSKIRPRAGTSGVEPTGIEPVTSCLQSIKPPRPRSIGPFDPSTAPTDTPPTSARGNGGGTQSVRRGACGRSSTRRRWVRPSIQASPFSCKQATFAHSPKHGGRRPNGSWSQKPPRSSLRPASPGSHEIWVSIRPCPVGRSMSSHGPMRAPGARPQRRLSSGGAVSDRRGLRLFHARSGLRR